MQMTITNRYSSALATQYGYFVIDDAGDTVYRYDGGYENAPSFMATGGYQTAATHATPPVGFSFAEDETAKVYTIVHTVREGTGGDDHRDNDTVCFRQVLADYYAYDDGTPENGYGLTTTASKLYLAYRFDLNVADTLSAVDIYFNSTKNQQNEQVWFYLTVWRCGDDGRPAEVLYRDSDRRRASGSGFGRYQLDYGVIVDGSVFVGLEQVGNDYINIGFDRSWNSADRVWYLTSTEWQQSILSGSLMIRPCFGSSALGIENVVEKRDLHIWPNPASQRVMLDGISDGEYVEIFDLCGRKVFSTNQSNIEVDGWLDGAYVVRVISKKNSATAHKLIIKH